VWNWVCNVIDLCNWLSYKLLLLYYYLLLLIITMMMMIMIHKVSKQIVKTEAWIDFFNGAHPATYYVPATKCCACNVFVCLLGLALWATTWRPSQSCLCNAAYFPCFNSFYVWHTVLFLVKCLSELLLYTARSMSPKFRWRLFIFSSRLSLDYTNFGYYRHS